MYSKCRGDFNAALTHFNHARCDSRWNATALVEMIEIYLSLDDVNFWIQICEETDCNELKRRRNTVNSFLDELSMINSEHSERIAVFRGYAKMLCNDDDKLDAFHLFQSILTKKKVSII